MCWAPPTGRLWAGQAAHIPTGPEHTAQGRPTFSPQGTCLRFRGPGGPFTTVARAGWDPDMCTYLIHSQLPPLSAGHCLQGSQAGGLTMGVADRRRTVGGGPLRVAWSPRGGPCGQEAGEPGKRPLPGDPQSWPSNSPTPRPTLQCLICKKRAGNSHLANLQAGLWEPRQSQLCHSIKLATNAHLDGALSLVADAVLSPRPVGRQPLPRKLPSADESPGLGIDTVPRRTPDSAVWTGERLPCLKEGQLCGSCS